MLRPSYTELMDKLNEDIDLDSKITSRYTIVIAAAKRARQIINGASFDAVGSPTDKAVSIAVNEMIKGAMKIFPEGLPQEENEYQVVSEDFEKAYRETYKDNSFGSFDDEDDFDEEDFSTEEGETAENFDEDFADDVYEDDKFEEDSEE